jgi:hypothetical protein
MEKPKIEKAYTVNAISGTTDMSPLHGTHCAFDYIMKCQQLGFFPDLPKSDVLIAADTDEDKNNYRINGQDLGPEIQGVTIFSIGKYSAGRMLMIAAN